MDTEDEKCSCQNQRNMVREFEKYTLQDRMQITVSGRVATVMVMVGE